MKVIAVVLIVSLLVGCANTGASYRPLVDLRNQTESQYQTDLQECQYHAKKVLGTGETAAAGAVTGALVGAAVASLFGGSRKSRNDSSMYGALAGAGSGAAKAENEQRTIIRRCLAGRGYNVLN